MHNKVHMCVKMRVYVCADGRRAGILYLRGRSLADTHLIIQTSFCLVNSSHSEGMCMAILEVGQPAQGYS